LTDPSNNLYHSSNRLWFLAWR